LLGPNLLVGALVQVDSVTDNWRTTGASVKGTGWMTGPYATWRLSENLFLDGRLAWGESSNKVSPYGLYEDKFDTQRGLARVNLTGNWVFDNFRITPSVALTYFREHQLAYTDSLGVYIPSQDVSLGRMTFGPEFGYRFSPSPSWTVEPHVALMGLWDFQKDQNITIQGVTVGTQPIRARLQGGVMTRNTDNFALRWTVSYDGIGDRSLNVYGTQLWLNVPLRAADNVRWPVKAPPIKWMGAYGGIQFGASQANFRNDFLFGGDWAPGAKGGSADRQLHAIAGLFAGYNYRWDKVVAGVEADVTFRRLSATNESRLFTVPFDNDDGFFVSNKLGTTGSLRARLGYAWNKSLLYGTAGVVIGRVQSDIRSDGGPDLDMPDAIYSQSAVRVGWTAGAGVEHSVTDNWFVRGEFRYSQFGAKPFSVNDPALAPEHGPNTNNNSVSLTQGLFGIGYRF
jgi:opacity protein-like surface antigen